MFFKNQKPHQWTFDERLGDLKKFRFEVKSQGTGALVIRDGCGAMLENLAEGKVKVGRAGLLVGSLERNPWAAPRVGPVALQVGVTPLQGVRGDLSFGPSVVGRF